LLEAFNWLENKLGWGIDYKIDITGQLKEIIFGICQISENSKMITKLEISIQHLGYFN